MSEDRATAELEYNRIFSVDASLEPRQPAVEFHARVRLAARGVIDLMDTETIEALGLIERDLFAQWRHGQLAPTQLLGAAIDRLGTIAAARYPSAAAHEVGASGTNVVIFRAGVKTPDSVEIIGPRGALQVWS